MKTILAAALIALLALSAPDKGFTADEGEQAGSTTESTTTEEGKGDAASDTKEQDSDDDKQNTTEDETKTHGMNVHRHRAGACPEGPPCPTE
jgi:hypothetical protein